MASDQAIVATSAPVLDPPLSGRSGASSTIEGNLPDAVPARAKSLKRGRAEQSTSPSNFPLTNTGVRVSHSAKSPRFNDKISPGYAPMPLTGAAALADERRKREEVQRFPPASMSENPGHKALTALMAGGGLGMSRAQHTPGPTTSMSQAMCTAANAITIPSPRPNEEKSDISPASVTSLASLGSTAPTATANSVAVASPSEISSTMEFESRNMRAGGQGQLQPSTDEQHGRMGGSYPGTFPIPGDNSRAPPRGMSLPMPGQNQQLAPKSPTHKKHKCPYCETEFTRHHNLKSHLLTHSQEKPYVCQTCNMRFRRLHDLKRHMKLHTGERPHICPKCKRKFARGDALARHSKGQGGCAGRRASMGEFGGEEDYEGSTAGDGDDGMDGVMYNNGTPQGNEGEMSEEERRRLSLPSIKAQHVASNHGSQDSYTSRSRGPSTYPPAGPRQSQSSGGLYPPSAQGSGSSGGPSMQNSHTPNMSMSSMPLGAGGGAILPQGMTESPKPLSPSGMHGHQLGHDPASLNRQQSPSLTTQFQQAHFGRRQSGRASPPGMSFPSPRTTSHGPKLPAISGLAPPETRYTPTSQPANGSAQTSTTHSPSTMFQPPLGSVHSRGHSMNNNSDNSNNLFAAGEHGVWVYIQSLEEKVKHLSDKVQTLEKKEKSLEEKNQEDKINRLSEEVISLRGQLNAQNQLQHPPSGLGHS